jgi:site-specific DNA-methyltransferase (adenine-specific)
MSNHRVIHGDCTTVLRDLARDAVLVDSVVTDPPYHLASIVARLGQPDSAPIQSGVTGVYARSSQGFMGQQWDGGDVAFRPETWRRVFDVMKPGAHLVAFAATKGYHRMACAIEDAGFEIRDMIAWLYGSGFPKSHNVANSIDKLSGEPDRGGRIAVASRRHPDGTLEPNGQELPKYVARTEQGKPWEGWGTALKPAIEPIIVARKPLNGSVAENSLRWGVGALNIDACRIDLNGDYKCKANGRPSLTGLADGYDPANANIADTVGRWPANVCHDGSEEVMDAFAAYGERGAIAPVHTRGADKFRNTYGAFAGNVDEAGSTFRGDSGTAARFFYSSKATQGERIFECRECGAHSAGKPSCGHTDMRTHPTVKPISLMRWLVELVTPPAGLVLDPFAGTGTTAAAAREAGFQSLSIEADENHVRDIGVRLGIDVADLIAANVQSAPIARDEQGDMFL